MPHALAAVMLAATEQQSQQLTLLMYSSTTTKPLVHMHLKGVCIVSLLQRRSNVAICCCRAVLHCMQPSVTGRWQAVQDTKSTSSPCCVAHEACYSGLVAQHICTKTYVLAAVAVQPGPDTCLCGRTAFNLWTRCLHWVLTLRCMTGSHLLVCLHACPSVL